MVKCLPSIKEAMGDKEHPGGQNNLEISRTKES